jgi:hypothetical protein
MRIVYRITPEKKDDGNQHYIYDVVEQLRRDVSWGTYSDGLAAVERTLGNNRWEQYQPDYEIQENIFVDDGCSSHRVTLVFNHDHQFNFQEEGINHFIGTIAGNIIRNRKIKNIVVEDFYFSQNELNYFPGPILGIEKMRSQFFARTLNSPRPLLAFSIKPRIGLSPEDYRKVIQEASDSHIDLIEDDERLVSPAYCSFEARVKQIEHIIENYNPKSKFSINLTCSPFDIQRRIDIAYNAGIRVFKLDVTVSGFDSLLHLRNKLNEKDDPCLITVFPDVYGTVYRCLSREFILKLSRLCGADIIYAGSPSTSRMGALLEKRDQEKWWIEVKTWINALRNVHRLLIEPFPNSDRINTSLPTITHDIDLNFLETLIYVIKLEMNNHMDYAFFVGGGISGMGCGLNLRDSARLWLDVIKYAGNYDLEEYRIDAHDHLTRFNQEGYRDCLHEMGIPIFYSDEEIPYKAYDFTS